MNSTLLMTPAVGMVIALILGVFVISNKPSQKINQVFSLLCFETFIWQLCWFVSYFITGPHLKDLVVRIAFSDVVFIPFTYYHFTIIFLGASTQKNRAWSAYSFATIFLISDLFFAIIILKFCYCDSRLLFIVRYWTNCRTSFAFSRSPPAHKQ